MEEGVNKIFLLCENIVKVCIILDIASLRAIIITMKNEVMKWIKVVANGIVMALIVANEYV